MRLHLFEFEDLKWFPEPIRSGATDYLRFLLKALKFYQPSAHVISHIAETTGNDHIIDLCSGGGGPAEQLSQTLPGIRFVLTDKFPNIKAWQFIETQTKGLITYSSKFVDAFSENINTAGTRTMFSAIHHFTPNQIRLLIKNISRKNNPIIFFDGGNKNVAMILALVIIHPILSVVTSPFLKPFRLSRLFFTWIIPLIPFVTVWDGFVSILRLYSPAQLLKIAKEAEPGYLWKAGYIKSKFGLRIAFLYGYSKEKIKMTDDSFFST